MDRSYMTMFRAVKGLMLSLREETQPVKVDRTIEVDEVYVEAEKALKIIKQRISGLESNLST